jgi:Sap, sulfolipid-1-addressing protein
MLAEAAGLAVLAALSPTALLIAAIYLGSARPRLTAAFYLTGAVVMSLVMGVVILVVLRNVGLSHSGEHAPRYGLRLGFGLLLLVAGLVIAKRKPKAANSASQRPGLVARMAADPAPRSAFLVGVLVFAPGATFLAALQVIATAHANVEATAVAIIVVVAINVALVWLPIVLHVLAPERTTRYLAGFNTWLRRNGGTVLTWVLLVAGGVMVGTGIHGLAT